ncbi:NUDIX domain-containing protein [bacterium]|nr:NUDIX domain-containing protein [bacterium]
MLPLIQTLEERLSGELPGWAAQRRAAPPNRAPNPTTPPPDARFASVLIALYPFEERIHTGLILRPSYPGVHGGQVAFPGGKREPEDTDDIATALREAEEEVGLARHLSRVVGCLSPVYIPPSRYWVHPVVSVLDHRPAFVPDQHEVERVLELPLAQFTGPEVLRNAEFGQGEQRFETPAYHWNNFVIWGATAMMISELMALLDDQHDRL